MSTDRAMVTFDSTFAITASINLLDPRFGDDGPVGLAREALISDGTKIAKAVKSGMCPYASDEVMLERPGGRARLVLPAGARRILWRPI
jgi:hypothetical protein